MGHKSHDFAFAAMCHPAHEELARMTRSNKEAEWMLAHVQTMRFLWENGLVGVVK